MQKDSSSCDNRIYKRSKRKYSSVKRLIRITAAFCFCGIYIGALSISKYPLKDFGMQNPVEAYGCTLSQYDEVDINVVHAKNPDKSVRFTEKEPLAFETLLDKLSPDVQPSQSPPMEASVIEPTQEADSDAIDERDIVPSFASVLQDDRYVLGLDTATKLYENEIIDIRNKGYEFVGRYLVPENIYPEKALSKQEAQLLSNAGLKILSVFETTEDRASSGTYGGTQDGKMAYEQAKLMGMPKDSTIYFAVDYDAQPSEYDKVKDYFNAARAQLHNEYRIGIYGGYFLFQEMMKDNLCDVYWQACAWSTQQDFINEDGKYQQYRYLVDYEANVFQATTNVYVGIGLPGRDVCIDQNGCLNMDDAGLWSLPIQE